MPHLHFSIRFSTHNQCFSHLIEFRAALSAGDCVRAVNVTQYKCEPGDVLVDENMVAALQPFHFDVEAIEDDKSQHAGARPLPAAAAHSSLASQLPSNDPNPMQIPIQNASIYQLKSQSMDRSCSRQTAIKEARATSNKLPPRGSTSTGGGAKETQTRSATFYRIRSLGAALRAIETDFEPRLLSRYTYRKSQPLCDPLEHKKFFETITKCGRITRTVLVHIIQCSSDVTFVRV